MKKHLLILMLCLIAFSALSQENFVLMGNIKDTDTFESLPNVHVVNLKTKKGTITNNKGFFWITVSKGDFLKVSMVGYHNQYLKIDQSKGDTLSVNLTKKIFELQTVTVYPWTKEEFRYKFMHDDIETDSIEKLRVSINVSKEELENLKRNAMMSQAQKNNPNMLSISLPMLPNYKTKKEKQILGLAHLKKWQDARKRYWKLAEEITGYQDDKLNEFIRYCHFSKHYIINAREYFLTLNLKKKMVEFERKK